MTYKKDLKIGWEEFHRDTRELAEHIYNMNRKWHSIVCITRGGLVPSGILSRELDIRNIETLGISSYSDYNNQTSLKIIKDITPEIKASRGKDILVIDELVDTGKTLQAAREILPEAYFTSIYVKPLGKPFIDHYIREVSQETWIYLPWDMAPCYLPPVNKDHKG